MTRPAGPRHASVHFPLAGDPERGLAAVRVIDWGQPGSYTRMTLAGPAAHELHKDEEIESAIRTERLSGGCRSAVPDGQLIVELVVADGQQVCGASYTLALVLADKLARGCLPRLAGRTLIASGRVTRDGSIAPVGRIGEKLAAIACALTQRPMATPLLLLPQGNLATLTTDEQSLLQGLSALGVDCIGVAVLSDMASDWPPQPAAAPGREPPAARRRRWVNWLRALVGSRCGPLRPVPEAANALDWRRLLRVGVRVLLSIVLVLVLFVALYQVFVPPGPCASLSADPAFIERCAAPLPVTFRGDCSVEHGNGERSPRRCPSGTCLAARDVFALEVRPGAAGWLYVYYLDAAGQALDDLRPGRKAWEVAKGQRLPLTLPARTNPPFDRPARGRFLAVLTREPLPSPQGTPASVLTEYLGLVAEELVLCGDPH